MTKPFVHGGNIYEDVPERGAWLDFSANINPLGLSAQVQEAIDQNIGGLVHYPDPNGTELRKAIHTAYAVPVENIILGNGAAELLYIFFHCFRPKRVLLPVPSFSEYERAALAADASVEYLFLPEDRGFALDVQELIQQLAAADCVVLGNPNNPTGELLEREQLAAVAAAAERTGCRVIVDESFMDFRQDAVLYSAMELTKRFSNLFVLHSLTKFYAIPGLRLGFGVLAAEDAARLDRQKDPWNVNLLAHKAGVAALQDSVYKVKSQELLARESSFMTAALKKLSGVTVFEPTVNFIFMDLKRTGMTAAVCCKKMKRLGILVRDCSNYPGLGDTFIRAAIRTREENERLLAALRTVLEEEA